MELICAQLLQEMFIMKSIQSMVQGKKHYLLIVFLKSFKCCILHIYNKIKLRFFSTFSFIARMKSIQTMLAIATIQDHKMHQMDVKTSLLNGDLSKEIPFQ